MMEWEKNFEIYKRRNKWKKFPVWLLSLSYPRLRSGGWLFSGDRKHRKQAGPTLSGRGFLILLGKKKDRVGRGMGS